MKKPLTENFIFCAVFVWYKISIYSFSPTKFLNIGLVSRIQKIQVLMNNETRSKDMPKYRGSIQTHHVDSMLKRRGNGRFHFVSTWNTHSVFVGMMLAAIQ